MQETRRQGSCSDLSPVMGFGFSNVCERLHFHFSLSCIGEGNGNPLQCSCLESPRDGGAWWEAVYGVAQSRTRLKRLSSSSSSALQWLPRGLSGKESICNAGDTGVAGSIPRWRRSPGGENGNPLQYSCLENPRDGGAWWEAVYGVAQRRTWVKRLSSSSSSMTTSEVKHLFRSLLAIWTFCLVDYLSKSLTYFSDGVFHLKQSSFYLLDMSPL